MEPPITYQQLLSQHYEENARDLLVLQQSDSYNVEPNDDVDPHNASHLVGMELTNPEDFNRFGGDRNDEQLAIKPKEFVDMGKTSVRYNKDVETVIFCIDTRFRAFAAPGTIPTAANLITNKTYVSPVLSTATSITSYFMFHVQKMIRNVISAKLTSFELPNTFCNIVDIRHNHYVWIRQGGYFAGENDDPVLYPKLNAPIEFTVSTTDLNNYVGPQFFVSKGRENVNVHPGMAIVFSSINIVPVNLGYTYYIKEVHDAGPLNDQYVVISSKRDLSDTIAAESGYSMNGTANWFTQIPVFITDFNTSMSTLVKVVGNPGSNSFYYSNKSIIPALTKAFGTTQFSDISVSYVDGHCQLNNNSLNTYCIDFTPTTADLDPQVFPTLGRMLGYNYYTYQLNPPDTSTPAPSPCDFDCGQISACQCYGSLTSEDAIDMNADPYIYLTIAEWNNVQHESVNGSYFTAFARILINIEKGKTIFDTLVTNTVTKLYHFKQPTNIQQAEIKLVDMSGNLLIMPNTNWSMALEVEEVISQSLYEKLREL